MTAPNVNRQQDTLGKLLATEDIRIVRLPQATASFDTVTRVLYLPTWAGVSKNVVDLFIGHEVAHALWTSSEDWLGALKANTEHGYKSFLNIVEDARIEKKIKRKYPGLKKPMFDGYSELVQQNFFGAGFGQFNKLLFLDRLNVHFKVGSRAAIKFSAEEQVFVDAIEACETFQDVVNVVEQLWGFCEAEREELRQQVEEAKKKAAKKAKKESKQDDEEQERSLGEAIEVDADEDDDDSDDEDSDEQGGASESDDEDEDDDSDDEGTKGKGSSSDDEDEDEDEDDDEDEKDDSDDEDDRKDADEDETPSESESNKPGSGASVGGKKEAPKPKTDEELEKEVEEQIESDEAYSLTEEALEKAQENLVDYKNTVPTFSVMPRLRVSEFVIPYRQMYADFDVARSNERTADKREKMYDRFMRANKAYVNMLVQTFNLKRTARKMTGARTAKTGKLDTKRAYRFKFSEDLFSSTTILPQGTNHGMLKVIDMSSSMSDVIAKTFEQTILLAMFCRKVNIPFAVYGFSDSGFTAEGQPMWDADKRNDKDPSALQLEHGSFHFKELLSSEMPLAVFNSAVKDLLMVSRTYDWRNSDYTGYSSNKLWGLSGTPLLDTFILLRQIAMDFKRKTKVEVLNTILLSDGDGAGALSANNDQMQMRSWGEYKVSTYVLTDRETKAMVATNEYGYNHGTQCALMDMYRKATGSRLMVLYLAKNKRDMERRLTTLHTLRSDETSFEDKVKNEWGKDGFVDIDTKYTDAYYILDAKEMSAEEVSMDEQLAKSKSKSLFRAFRDMQDQKAVSRVFVNRFIDSIA